MVLPALTCVLLSQAKYGRFLACSACVRLYLARRRAFNCIARQGRAGYVGRRYGVDQESAKRIMAVQKLALISVSNAPHN